MRKALAYVAAPLLPLLCAIHCLAAPLLASFLPVLSPSEELETILLVVTAVVATLLLRRGVRQHGARWLWTLLCAAGLAWAAALVADEELAELLLPAGHLLASVAMLVNAALLHRSTHRQAMAMEA